MSTRAQVIVKAKKDEKPVYVYHPFDGHPKFMLMDIRGRVPITGPNLTIRKENENNMNIAEHWLEDKKGNFRPKEEKYSGYIVQKENAGKVYWNSDYIYELEIKNNQWYVTIRTPTFFVNDFDSHTFDTEKVKLEDFKPVWKGYLSTMTQKKANAIDKYVNDPENHSCPQCGKLVKKKKIF